MSCGPRLVTVGMSSIDGPVVMTFIPTIIDVEIRVKIFPG
jgi:hypothetical protein